MPKTNLKLLGLLFCCGLIVVCGQSLSRQKTDQAASAQAQVTAQSQVIAAGVDLCTAEGDHTLNSGENTYDGQDIDISGCTFTINGSHSFTSLNVLNGGILTHSGPVTTSVTRMTLAITNALNVDATSQINVTGKGFFGGGSCGSGSNLGYTSDGAGGGIAVYAQSAGQGPAHGGRGINWNGASNTDVYDSVINPTEPGAGGAEWNGCGGNGGGVIIITAASALINGTVAANATTNAWIGGAGGTINIQTTGTISGSGSLSANGTAGSNNFAGGGGRIALSGSSVSFPLSNIANAGGNSSAGAGTIYIKETDDVARPNGKLYVQGSSSAYATPVSGSQNYDNITVSGGAKLTLVGAATVSDAITLDNGGLELNTTGSSVVTANSFSMQNSSTLTHYPTSTSVVQRLRLNVNTTFTQDATSTISVAGRGFLGGGSCSNTNLGYTSDGNGGMVAVFPQSTSQGPAHGGRGVGWNGASNTEAYDSVTNPTEPGAGGGEWYGCGGNGGGSIIISAASFTLDGIVNADAVNNAWIGGAGGTINLQATGTIGGSASLSANGSSGTNNIHGGGGRIALIASTVTIPIANITNAPGGTSAGPGTIYIKETSDVSHPNGKLYVKGTTSYYATPVAGSGNYDTITVSGGGKLSLVGASTVSDTISLDNGGLELNTTGSSIVTANTFTMQNGSLLTHYPTDTTTVQRLRLNVATSFTQDATSSITVVGRGFMGGGPCGSGTNLGYTSNGSGGMVAVFPQSTQVGPAHGGRGVNWSGASSTDAYDSLTNPTEPGAGGGEWNSCGGFGGGSVLINAADITLNGTNTADAGAAVGWIGGAGGTLNFQASGTISGSGTLSANGTLGNNNTPGGGGRIALIASTITVPVSGITVSPGGSTAGPGTIYIKQTSDSNHPNGVLYVKGTSSVYATPVAGSYNFDSITVSGGGKINLQGASTIADTVLLDNGGMQIETTGTTAVAAGTFTMQNSSILTHAGPSTTAQNKINLNVTNAFSLSSNSQVNLNGKGFYGGGNCGSGSNLGYTSDGAGGGTPAFPQSISQGPAHGGRGVNWSGADNTNVYDSITNPTEPGAGGGEWNGCGGHGGGVLIVTAGSLSIDGTISADATVNAWIGGAGGTINLSTTGLFSGNGTFTANGSNGSNSVAGGGGRIAVTYASSTFSGTMTAYGGSVNAAAGTVYTKQASASEGDLVIDNNNANVAALTPAFYAGSPTTRTFYNVTAKNYGKLLLDTPGTSFTVNGATTIVTNGQIINNLGAGFVQAALNITTTSLPSAVVGVAYNQTVQAGGGYGPYTWTCRSAGSTVACSTVLPSGLDMNSSGVISGTPTLAGTYNFTVRATEASPGVGIDDQALSITVGNAPTAPTSLFSHSSDAQSCCSPATTDATPVFSAIFNDPDVGDTASKYQIQVASDNGFSTLLWDSGSSGTSFAATAVGSRSPNINYGGSALTLGGTTYYWRIKFWDSADIAGPFSATATFVTSTAPMAPTNLFSNDSSAQSGLTNPVGVNASRPVFSAIYQDPDLGDTANKYRIQVDDNNDFSSLVWDSGAAGTSMTTCNQGARCADLTYGAVTPLTLDGTKYYWRIKFFDAAGLEGPWSEDPTATTNFTVALSSSSIQRITQQQQQSTAPAAPKASSVEVINSTTLRYNWIDQSNNETGFRLLDDKGSVIAEVGAGVTSAQETNLAPNTAVSGRKVVAYNAIGVSAPSDVFATTVTAAPAIKPVLVQRGSNSVTFTVTPVPANLGQGQSALLYELLVKPADATKPTKTLTSDWINKAEFTFANVLAGDTVEVRVQARNQSGLSTNPSEYVPVATLTHQFAVSLAVVKKGTNQLPRPVSPTEIISVTVGVRNTGTEAATNVFATLPIPPYVNVQPRTLVVDGKTATDFADEDAGQVDNGMVSLIWSRIAANESHTATFDLVFDQVDLKALLTNVAAANPLINLQVSLSFAESDSIFTSPAVTLEPDLSLLGTVPQPVMPEIPVPPPTENDSNEVGYLLNSLIQQEASQSQVTQPQAPVSLGPQTQTNVSHDAQSFNVDVTRTDGTKLSVSGYASPTQGQIEFTGTTSQPNAIVTLIFNDHVTVLVTSDENGNWRTFVSAEQLGIKPGQSASVKIEAIAAKGDLRSDKVEVGSVTVSLETTGDVQTQFETIVSSSRALTTVNEVRKAVAKQIVQQQPAIQTSLATTAPVVIVSSAPLWGYLPYLPTMIYHFITYAVGLLGRKRKKQQRFYGVVYDSISKQPLALAIIRIYNKETNRLVATQVSDKQGRYDALLEPASYRLEVTKPSYSFPSHIVTADIDGKYQHVYHNEQGIAVQSEEITVPDVPLDPVNAQRQWQISGFAKKLWLALQNVGNYLAVPVLMVGALASVVVLMTIPNNPINWLLSILYVGMFAAQLKLRPHIQKAWGVVYDLATNAALPLTTIQLIDPQYGKVVTSRLTDYQGRYSFMPEPGHYVVKASKPGYEQVKEVIESANDKQHHPMTPEIEINKPDQRITGDVPMKAEG